MQIIKLKSGLVFPLLIRLAFKDVSYSFASVAITIRIYSLSHLCVFFLVIKKLSKFAVNDFFVCAHKFQGSSIHTFRTFCCIPHNQNRNTIGWSLFLDSATICQNKI